MKKILITLVSCIIAFNLYAQHADHESFKKDNELKAALLKYDMKEFVDGPVTFIYDTLEVQADAPQLNTLIKQWVPVKSNHAFKKASETNNGYIQSFGLYNKDGDALYYVRFTLNPLSGKLEEVNVEKNN